MHRLKPEFKCSSSAQGWAVSLSPSFWLQSLADGIMHEGYWAGQAWV